jgi:hypothetical protein
MEQAIFAIGGWASKRKSGRLAERRDPAKLAIIKLTNRFHKFKFVLKLEYFRSARTFNCD